jgi:ROK family protein
LAEEIGSAITSLRASAAEEAAGDIMGAPAPVVGICVPGIVDEDEGRVRHSDVLGLQDAPLASLVGRILAADSGESAGAVGVTLYQDARCGALAESRWGAGGQSCLYLSVGERISAAVLLDGVPVLGGGWAGQVGRVLVPDPDWSGERARLKDVASVDAMVRRYTAGLVDDSGGSVGSVGSDVSAARADSLSSGLDSLLGAMRSGDREARRVWDTGLDALADLIARGAGLLGPIDVVISSELTRAGEAVFLEPLRGRVAVLMAGLPAPRLVPARLGNSARALGAAGRALKNCQ